MLSRHALVIAAIFVPYLILMTGLGVYIWRSGQPRRRDDDDGESGREQDAGPVLTAA